MTVSSSPAPCTIVPPYLLARLVDHPDEAVAEFARRSLERDRSLREHRSAGVPPTSSTPDHPVQHQRGLAAPHADDGTGPQRTIADARGGETTPGTTVRTEGQAATGDPAADEAYDGFGQTWALFDQTYGRDSLDGQGLPLLGTVHYGHGYDNAFWDGTQMVFGDGDGTVFNRFTIAVDVIGHELTHGVTEHTAALVYQGQSGALNESLSDVFGSMVKQRALGQDAASADWLIGAGLFTTRVKGAALRSMKAPGTAYDDPELGKDPQPATMADYVETADDNGGVHLNSGIPNHALPRCDRHRGTRLGRRRPGVVRRADRRGLDRHRRLRDLRPTHRRGRRAPVCRGVGPGDRHPVGVGAGRGARGRRLVERAHGRNGGRSGAPAGAGDPGAGAPHGWAGGAAPGAHRRARRAPRRGCRGLAGVACRPPTAGAGDRRTDPTRRRRLHLPRGLSPGR
jgi:hypothetical protein